MKSHSFKTFNVYLTLDPVTILTYFNKHDPAPIYKRQLSHQFAQYIMEIVHLSKKYDVIFYKFRCINEIDKQYAEPVMYAIRSHFTELKNGKIQGFKKFKRHNLTLLAAGTVLVMLFHFLLPLILPQGEGVSSGVGNSLEIFSWVILWRPIDELVFSWNTHLKEISLLDKLSTSELIMIENEKKAHTDNSALRVVA